MQSSGQSLWTSAIHINVSLKKLKIYTCLSSFGYIKNDDKRHKQHFNVVDNTIHEHFVDK